MNKRFIKSSFFLLSLLATPAFASPELALLTTSKEDFQQTLKGKVLDQNGFPISGVSIKVKNQEKGTSTDVNGDFELPNVSMGISLVISYVGYETQEIIVENYQAKSIVLQMSSDALEEVVVVGYGTQKRKELTGSISSIKASDLEKVSATSFTSAIQGKVPGVTITQTTGAPGGAASVRIRGVGTTGGNQPLYVIDGFPVGGGGMSINGSSDNVDGMAIVNPNDIESVEILKDAAAASIYGARAANGVILITTKRGKEGVSTAEINAYTGIASLWKKPKFLNAEQFATLANELYTNSGMATNPEWANPRELGVGTNWIDEIFRSAPLFNVDLSVTGGNQKVRNALSLGYSDQQGTIIETRNRRYTGRANVDVAVTEKLKIGGSLAFSYVHGKGQRNEDFRLGIFNLAQQFYPTLGREEVITGSSEFYSTQGDNPYLRAKSMDNFVKNMRLYGNAFGEYEITTGLKFKSSLGLDFASVRNHSWEPKVQRGFYNNPQATLTENQSQGLNWLLENVLNFDKSFGNHRISAVIGQSAQKNTNDWLTIVARDYQNEALQVINGSSDANRKGTGTGSHYTLASYLGRINYNYQDRYLLSASIRRDGSSNFGPAHKWGNFPSVSAGWNVSEESFFHNEGFINSLKLRTSWGQLGNDAIGAYGYSSTLGIGRVSDNYILGTGQSLKIGAGMVRPGNENLKWETSEQLNFGADIGFLDGKGYATVEYYIKDTKDMLVSLPVSLEAGFESAPSVNGGKIRNSGFELLLGYSGGNEFKYDVSVNMSTLSNKVISLGAGNPISGPLVGFTAMNSSYTEIGQPIGYFRGYIVEGIYQTDAEVDKSFQPNASAGDFKFKDVNGDNILSDADRVKLGSPWADVTYGLNMDFSYKGFDLNMLIQGVTGNDIFHAAKFSTYPMKYFGGSGVINASADILNRWTAQSGGNSTPILKYTDLNGNYANLSSFYIEDGSYLRLRNLTLGYTLPNQFIEKTKVFKRLRLYMSAQNLFTITNYSGFDPEVGSTNPLASGVDKGVYPVPRTYMFGVKMGF
ncbi:TonB-dependent receptor [Sphingobacterium sp. UT-1RO-CII-1]|uniref:SusC/RagA family TonB-linked outer membrane protein n=1 Tax=Sphingobacterium sp. UT-1RO-CII-1 TaxID=2995225 RepID=UPI00227ADA85|nr:TonB-dependent receptor [Sphingobacterium sp. UT-1RO-CII-1]MCY4779029.1 TonB-dependent receptor [Sphingobacterium sp. UT-1RO-CII-1]